MLLSILIIGSAIFFNSLCVATGVALIVVRTSLIDELIEQGNQAAVQVKRILDNPALLDRYVTTSQLGSTGASLLLGMYGASLIDAWQHTHGVQWLNLAVPVVQVFTGIVVISALTCVLVVVGEILPRSLALHNPERVACWTEGFLRVLVIVSTPLTMLINLVGQVLLHLFDIPRVESHRRMYSLEQLEQVVVESHKGGMLSDDEQQIIQNIFDLSERRVGQAMTPRPRIEAIPLNIEPTQLYDFIATSPYSRFPVYEDDIDHIIGMLVVKDFVRQQLEHPEVFDLRSLIRTMPAVPEAMTLDRLLVVFKHSHTHMALVFDEYGGTAGVVTLEDVVEEVVGEVHDEFDQGEQPPFYESAPGLYFVRGDLMLDDLLDHVPNILPEYEDEDFPDVDTVGGLVVSLLGRPAKPGDQIPFQQALFTVESINGLAIDMVRIVYWDEDAESTDSASSGEF